MVHPLTHLPIRINPLPGVQFRVSYATNTIRMVFLWREKKKESSWNYDRPITAHIFYVLINQLPLNEFPTWNFSLFIRIYTFHWKLKLTNLIYLVNFKEIQINYARRILSDFYRLIFKRPTLRQGIYQGTR